MFIRSVTPADLDLICVHRERMFDEAGVAAPDLATMAGPFRRWLAARLAGGTYFGFVAEEDGRSIGAVGLTELDWPPHPLHPADDRRGYVLNLFVEPEYRKRGVARTLLTASDREFTQRGLIYAVLHATAMGVPLYERLGWTATSEMAKHLRNCEGLPSSDERQSFS